MYTPQRAAIGAAHGAAVTLNCALTLSLKYKEFYLQRLALLYSHNCLFREQCCDCEAKDITIVLHTSQFLYAPLMLFASLCETVAGFWKGQNCVARQCQAHRTANRNQK